MRVSVPATVPATPAVDAPAAPAPGASGPALLDGALALLTLVFAFMIASFPAKNDDLWHYLATGRLVAEGAFPFRDAIDPFSALEPAPRWINHAWLSDLLLYSIYRAGGGTILVILKATLVALLAAILLRIRRPGAGYGLPAVTTILVLLTLIPAITMRPAVVSYALFAFLLLLLHRPPRRAALWRLPLAVGILFALWVNLDGGFVMGLLLLMAWLAGEALQRTGWLGISDPVDEPHSPAALALALGSALVGCIVSPYLFGTFTVPNEFIPMMLPETLRHDRLFEPYFFSPFDTRWRNQIVGPVAATGYYSLIGFGLISFFVNAGGWRWSRVLGWALFAWLSMTYWRIVPYFAIFAGPILVRNIQAFAARRAAGRTEPLSEAALHTRRFLANAGRVLAILAVLVLLGFAFPGWLAAEPARASRRVGWFVAADPTHERLATQLADWYSKNYLRPGEARGVYMSPEFAYYCAWFCPQEKTIFDYRLTAPLETIEDYCKLNHAMRDLTTVVRPGTKPPDRPDPLLAKYGITHVVTTGRLAVEGGLARAFFAQPWRWPPMAIKDRGVIVAWRREPHSSARLNVVRQAVGEGAEVLPPPPKIYPAPPEPSFWQRYREGIPTAPPETGEAALWLAYREATGERSQLATTLWQVFSGFGRAGTLSGPDLTTLFDLRSGLEATWQHSQMGARRASGVLAVRASRRATRVNPDDYEGYLRLAVSYRGFETDAVVGRIQQITAVRQALDRLPVITAAGQFTAADENVLHELLLQLYEQSAVPGGGSQPLDLMLESFERIATLMRRVAERAQPASAEEAQAYWKKADSEIKEWQKRTDALRDIVKQRRDNLETSAVKAQPATRAFLACQRGLVREALAALQDVDPKTLDPGLAPQVLHLSIQLLLLIGEAEKARDLLMSDKLYPITVLPVPYQAGFRILHVQTAAALGDYDSALANLTDAMKSYPNNMAQPIALSLLSLFAPDASPVQPLTRILTFPQWGGVWQSNGQPAVVNDRPYMGTIIPIWAAQQQQADWAALSGLLALEKGEVERAQRHFKQAMQTAGPQLSFGLRGAAQSWLEMFGK